MSIANILISAKNITGGDGVILKKIENLCKENGINMAKLEKECGLSNATVRRWEKASPSAKSLVRVADRFGVSVDYLLDRGVYSMSEETQKYAKQFEDLSEEKKQLAIAYMSVVKAQ
jgi:transcriptional regulator with XRE-family HTH domain